MKRSESVTKIVGALLNAQKLMGGATKGASNPYFKSKYADYGAVLEACKDLLNDNGVLILQPHVNHEGKSFVETTFYHESGEWISSETEVVCAKQNDPQALGSAITYARRYGLQSLLALPTEDDDGEKAMYRAPKNTNVATKQLDVTPTNKKVETTVQEAKQAEAAKPVRSSFKSASKAAETTPTPAANGAASKPAVAAELDWN